MFQSLINLLYRYPKSQINIWRKFGGYKAYKQMFADEHAMIQVSQKLVITAPHGSLPTLEVCFLTGKKFWHQTVFCAYTLQKHSSNPLFFHLYDDGTLQEVETIKTQVPNSRLISILEIENNLRKSLPKEKFPFLHHKRVVYKHIRKLTDIYTDMQTGWKLVLDSDMLFWRTPTQMLSWLQNPTKPFYILDAQTAYGYPIDAMTQLAQAPIQERINVGALGLHTSMVDFTKLEYWAKTLEQHYGTSYYLEQALSAMLIANTHSEVGAENEYIVYPSEAEVNNPTAALHHYVDVSKKWYFKKVAEMGSL